MEDQKKCLRDACSDQAAENRVYCSKICQSLDQGREQPFYSTSQLLKLLNISRQELYTVMRPVRSSGKILDPLFKPEHFSNKIVGRWVFTRKDAEKLVRYFKALKEYKESREQLRER